MRGAIKKQVQQVISVRTDPDTGLRYWHSDAPGWVPYNTLEMNAEMFSPRTKVIVKYGGADAKIKTSHR